LADENLKILGKIKIGEIFHGVQKFRGKSETEGKCIIASGRMDAPVHGH